MERRGFLGLVIGTVVGVPFVAEPAAPKRRTSKLDLLRARVRVFDLGDLSKFTCVVRTTCGDFRGPRITSWRVDPEAVRYELVFADIRLSVPVTVVGIRIHDDRGELVTDTDYSHPVSFSPGDTLRTTWSLKT